MSVGIRIKVIHPSGPATYHFWNGVTPVKDTPTDFGAATSDFLPIVEKTEAQFALIVNTAGGWFQVDCEDLGVIIG